MADINSAFPSKYLRADDLGDEMVLITIDRVLFEEFTGDNGQKERRPILYFRGGELKPLVLNKTNARKIADLCQDTDTDQWGGFQVRLYATETAFQGRQVPCVRIKQAAVPTRQQDQRRALTAQQAPGPVGDGTDPF
jgi:hypothetical protein